MPRTNRTLARARRLAAVAVMLVVGMASAAAAGSAAASQTAGPLAATEPVAAEPAAAASAQRALWVWDTSDPAATVDLAVAQGIGQLYAAVPPHVASSPQLPQLQELARLAGEAGLRVDALGGDPGWVDNPDWVVENWLTPALDTGLFAGVHVDIEPYTTPAWDKRRATVIKRYLGTLDTLRTAAGSTPVEADIPFWFDGIATGGSTLDREVMRRTDGVTVMAYRNTAAGSDGSIALSAGELQAGAELGKPVRIGQETRHVGDDATSVKQTFFGQTRTQMETQLAEITASHGASPAFAGFAIHDAAGYAAMAP